MKLFVAFRQQAVDLAGRDVDAQVQQLFVNQRLGDAVLMVLIEHVTAEPGPKMPCDVFRQRSRPAGAVGQEVPQPPVANVMRFDLQVLDHEILVAVLAGALGQPFQGQRDGLVNDQPARLPPFGRTGPFAPPLLLVRRIGVRRIQRARADRRPPRQPFHSGDLVAQRPNLRLLFFDHSQQAVHQWRPFFRRHLDVSNLDRLGSIHASQETPNRPPSKDQFHGVIENLLTNQT